MHLSSATVKDHVSAVLTQLEVAAASRRRCSPTGAGCSRSRPRQRRTDESRHPPTPLLDAALVVAALLDVWVHVEPTTARPMACALLGASLSYCVTGCRC